MPFSEEFITFKRRGTSNLAPADSIIFHEGYIQFIPSSDHLVVTSYEVRIRVDGSSTVVLAVNVGKPTPHPTTNRCYVAIVTPLLGLPPGNYTASVAAIAPGGTTDSGNSSAFSLPL